MKFRWHQTINNVVCCYQTPFNIALILEQVSNYNNVLREQVYIQEIACRRKNNMINEEHILKPRMNATSDKHAPNGLEDKNIENDSKVAKDDK